MSSTQWHLDDGRLAIFVDGNRESCPTAMEIFKFVFHGQRILGFQCPPVQECIPGLLFSRLPATPALHMSTRNGRLQGKFGVIADGTFVCMPNNIDQVVVGPEWYPIDIEELASTRQSAEEMGALGCDVRLAVLIKLRTTANLPFRLIDDAATSSLQLLRPDEKLSQILGVDATLYPYQEQGVRFLRTIAEQGLGCILADEMGLGKTLQVISLIQSEINEGRSPFLVIAPATLLENWRRELANFAPTIRAIVHAGSSRSGVASGLSQADVVLVSYDTSINDEPILSSIKWRGVVLDEAQAIKNPEALRTSAVKRLPREISIAVSGTPVENRVDDLWSVTDFCLPGLLGTLEQFRAEFGDDLSDAERLAPIVGPLILRRLVADVATDLPSRIDIPQAVEVSERMAYDYEAIRQSVLKEYGPAGGLVATTILRSFCAHPSLVVPWGDDPSNEMPKYVRLLEILEELFSYSEKALIFSSFQGIADIFQRHIPERFPGGFFRIIDGRTPVSERQEIVDAFFEHSGHGALFLNPRAAGTGLNITAANHVVHYNPEWNPALTSQASARAYRRKQTRPVTVHHLYFSKTVEEVIIGRAEFKRQLADSAVTGHEGDVPPSDIGRALQMSPLMTLGSQE